MLAEVVGEGSWFVVVASSGETPYLQRDLVA